jgi:type III restriction enzyme
MAKYLFGGFNHCLYPVQKFQSEPERRLAVILERDSLKWFRPARGQFQIYYKRGVEQVEYQPDFVAETTNWIYMLEPKRANQMEDEEVTAKRDAAAQWCKQASDHARAYGGKTWKYLLIPHNVIAENRTLEVLAQQFGVS